MFAAGTDRGAGKALGSTAMLWWVRIWFIVRMW